MIDYVWEMNHLTKEKPNDRYARVVNGQSKSRRSHCPAQPRHQSI
jgi:hypothetical protein